MSKIKMEKRNSKGQMNYAVIDLSSIKTYESFGWVRSTTQVNAIAPTPAERVIVKPIEVAKDIEEVKAKKEEIKKVEVLKGPEAPKVPTLPEDYEFLKLKEMKELDFVKFHFTAEEIGTWKTKAKAVESINSKK
jgi:hypothetical protein